MKKRKRRINWKRISMMIFSFSAIMYLLSSVFLRSYNSELNVKKQNYQEQIAALNKDNESAQMEVNQLSTYDRISAIASADGMSVTSNIITVDANE